MPSPAGWREVPCVECGEFVRGIGFVERCSPCQARRERRAGALATRAALVAMALMAVWVLRRVPNTSLGRWYAGVGIASTYLIVRFITRRVAMEVLR